MTKTVCGLSPATTSKLCNLIEELSALLVKLASRLEVEWSGLEVAGITKRGWYVILLSLVSLVFSMKLLVMVEGPVTGCGWESAVSRRTFLLG